MRSDWWRSKPKRIWIWIFCKLSISDCIRFHRNTTQDSRFVVLTLYPIKFDVVFESLQDFIFITLLVWIMLCHSVCRNYIHSSGARPLKSPQLSGLISDWFKRTGCPWSLIMVRRITEWIMVRRITDFVAEGFSWDFYNVNSHDDFSLACVYPHSRFAHQFFLAHVAAQMRSWVRFSITSKQARQWGILSPLADFACSLVATKEPVHNLLPRKELVPT